MSPVLYRKQKSALWIAYFKLHHSPKSLNILFCIRLKTDFVKPIFFSISCARIAYPVQITLWFRVSYLAPDLLIHSSSLTDRFSVLCSDEYQFTTGCFTGLNEVTGGPRHSLRKSIQQNLTLNPTLCVQKLPFSVSQSLESFFGKISLRFISQMKYC